MANKKKILFWPDVYKEQGHWLPTLAWAEYLYSMKVGDDENKFDIEYMGIADCRDILKVYSNLVVNEMKLSLFTYHEIFKNTYPEGYTNEVQTLPSNRWKPDHIWVMACAGFDESSLQMFDQSDDILNDAQDLQNVISDCSPDVLVSGYFTSLETLILYYHSKNEGSPLHGLLKQFAISTTYLRHPDEDPALHALQNMMAFSPEEQRKLINIVKNRKTDPNSWLDDCGCTLEEFVSPLRNFHEFIPCPSQFDYKSYREHHGSLVHYGEPCITRMTSLVEDDGAVQWDEVLKKPKLIFVTAGSQILDYEESALSLFSTMIDAMASVEMQDFHLILCVGSTLIQKNWACPDNVTVCGWAPQRKILDAMNKANLSNSDGSKTCCAIIHGGLATIKECIYYEVPFLVLPLGKDQMDNALRLEDCGIKNRFHVEYIKTRCLIYFINQVLNDYNSLNNLCKLSSDFRKDESKHTSARAIAHLADNGNLDSFAWN